MLSERINIVLEFDRKIYRKRKNPTRVIILKKKEKDGFSCSKFLPNFRYIKEGGECGGGIHYTLYRELGHFYVDYDCNRETHEFVATQPSRRKVRGFSKTLTQMHEFFNNKLLENNNNIKWK